VFIKSEHKKEGPPQAREKPRKKNSGEKISIAKRKVEGGAATPRVKRKGFGFRWETKTHPHSIQPVVLGKKERILPLSIHHRKRIRKRGAVQCLLTGGEGKKKYTNKPGEAGEKLKATESWPNPQAPTSARFRRGRREATSSPHQRRENRERTDKALKERKNGNVRGWGPIQ